MAKTEEEKKAEAEAKAKAKAEAEAKAEEERLQKEEEARKKAEEEEVRKAEEEAKKAEEEAEKKKAEAEKKAAEIEERARNEANRKKAEEEAKKARVVLKNVFGEDIDESEYFYHKDEVTGKEGGGKAPSWFNKICGFPVDREDMLVIFNRIFKPHHGFLFYKLRDKEVYLVIVPLKYANTVGGQHESLNGDFQKHAVSFIFEGSVNLESLRLKLERVASTIRIEE